jgi:hypothetical protein
VVLGILVLFFVGSVMERRTPAGMGKHRFGETCSGLFLSGVRWGWGGTPVRGGGPLAGLLPPMGSFWHSDIRTALVSSVGFMTDRAFGSAIDQRWK